VIHHDFDFTTKASSLNQRIFAEPEKETRWGNGLGEVNDVPKSEGSRNDRKKKGRRKGDYRPRTM